MNTFLSEHMTPQKQEAVKAIKNLSAKIRNQEQLSDAEISRILAEIKSIHTLYKEAFKEPAFSWQIDYYEVRMALENEYKLIYSRGKRLTWTRTRWKFALITELAVRYYNCNYDIEITLSVHGFQLMCFWLFFQFFKAEVFSGSQCMEVINSSFKTVRDADAEVSNAIQLIKKWREDNDALIQKIKFYRSLWGREVARIERLLYGHMKLNEVEMYHIYHWANPNLPFDENIKIVSGKLGISTNGLRKKLRDNGINKTNFKAYLTLEKEEAEAEYKKEYDWAKKVSTNTLSKTEKRDFWRKHTIPSPQVWFRTFSSEEPDLIPAANPLLTTDDCVPPSEPPRPIPSPLDCMYKGDVPQVTNMFGLGQPIEGLFS